jgi:hypothetical protein
MRQAAGAATWETLDELKQDDLDFQLEDELFACWEGKYYHKPLLPPSGLSVFLLVLYSFGDHLLLLLLITKRCPCSSHILRSQQVVTLIGYMENNINICVCKQVCYDNI